MGPLVSVVTPFFDTEQYLEKCIRSVLAQTYGNFEFLLCDNCSTDRSADIAAQFARQDSRIRLIRHAEFLDQDSNYNRAVRYVSSDAKYCKIVQADDWLHPTCLEEMVAAAERHPTAGIISACYIAGDFIGGAGLPLDRELFTGREACRTRLTTGGSYFGSQTCLLYRTDVIRSRDPLLHPEELHCDTQSCFQILRHSDFVRVPQILLTLRRDNVSISTGLRRFNSQSLLQYILVTKYGPECLSTDEQRYWQARTRRQYERLLALSLLQGAPRGLWTFHRTGLAEIGEELTVGRLLPAFLAVIADKLLNPLRTIQGLLERSSSQNAKLPFR